MDFDNVEVVGREPPPTHRPHSSCGMSVRDLWFPSWWLLFDMKDWPDCVKGKNYKCAFKSRQHAWLQKNLNIEKTARLFSNLSFTLLVKLVEFLTCFMFRLYYRLVLFRQVLGVQK